MLNVTDLKTGIAGERDHCPLPHSRLCLCGVVPRRRALTLGPNHNLEASVLRPNIIVETYLSNEDAKKTFMHGCWGGFASTTTAAFVHLASVAGREDGTVQVCSGSVSSDGRKGQEMC